MKILATLSLALASIIVIGSSTSATTLKLPNGVLRKGGQELIEHGGTVTQPAVKVAPKLAQYAKQGLYKALQEVPQEGVSLELREAAQRKAADAAIDAAINTARQGKDENEVIKAAQEAAQEVLEKAVEEGSKKVGEELEKYDWQNSAQGSSTTGSSSVDSSTTTSSSTGSSSVDSSTTTSSTTGSSTPGSGAFLPIAVGGVLAAAGFGIYRARKG